MEEEELDYEGPQFTEDPHPHSPNSLTDDIELMVSCFSNIHLGSSPAHADLNEYGQETPPELHNPSGLASNCCSSHQKFGNLQFSQSSTSTADPEDSRLDGQTQTVRLDPSFLFCHDFHSPDSIRCERSTSVRNADVGTNLSEHGQEASPERRNTIGLTSNCWSSHQKCENIPYPQSSTSIADPEDSRLDTQTQTVQIDPSFLFPLDCPSPESTTDERATSVLNAGVGTKLSEYGKEASPESPPPHSSTSVADPEHSRFDGKTQIVQIDPSFLFPLDCQSPDSTTNERSSPVLNVSVGTSADHHLLESNSNANLRSILKIKEKHGSYHKIIDRCLSILCAPWSSDDPYETAKIVFKNACFDQFFKGECSKDICLKDHHHLPDLTGWDSYTVWLVSQYVIFKAQKPKIEILKILVQFFSFTYDSTKTLAMAKCICKLSCPENIEFAHFLVKNLNCSTEKNAVMWVLFIAFSDLDSREFNALMEGLGVFKEDSSSYLELFNFLNFRAHALPAEHLVKLIDDIVIRRLPLKTEDFIGVVVGFLGRLPENDKERMEPVITQLTSKFDISSLDELRLASSTNVETREVSYAPYPSSLKRPVTVKKRVTFAEDTNGVCMLDPNHEGLQPACDGIQNFVEVPENNCEVHQPNDSACDEESEIVPAVLKNHCIDWILNGDCRNPICNKTHFFNKGILTGVPTESVVAAAEFFIEKSVCPNFPVLEGFVNILSKSNELSTLLSFRKCAPKLSTSDSSRLTVLIMSRLSRHVDHWSAIEMVLTPNLFDICNKHEDLFLFDSNLLKTVMTDAIMKKSNVLRCVSDEILRRVSFLPTEEKENIMETSMTFFRKFILNQRKILFCPDLHPVEVTGKFSSEFETELHKGSTNGYYVVSLMLKFAADAGDSRMQEAVDILYSFLLIQFFRARIIRDIFKRVTIQSAPTRKSILRLLGNASLCVILRLVEDGQLTQAAEMFGVLRKFRVNLFEIEHTFFEISNVELALIFCSLTVECGKHNDAIELFLNECLPPFLVRSPPGLPIFNRMNALIEKIFRKFNNESLWHEAVSFFDSIYSRQQSVLYPSNISKFYETTLRVCQCSPNNSEARQACLKLFLGMEDSGERFDLQTVTYRSLLLTAVKEKIISPRSRDMKDSPNMLHPLVKKLLANCMKAGAYSQFDSTGEQIIFYSTMTREEMKMYLVWWAYYLMRARKRAQTNHFASVNIKIIHDVITNDNMGRIYCNLEKVDNRIEVCGNRLFSVVKSLIQAPVCESMFRQLESDTFELSPAAVQEISQEVVYFFLSHSSSNSNVPVETCVLCLDKSPVEFDS